MTVLYRTHEKVSESEMRFEMSEAKASPWKSLIITRPTVL